MGQQTGLSLCILHHIPSQSDRRSNKPKPLIFHFLFFVSLWFLLWHRKSVIQRSGNFVRATNIFGYPREAPARFVLPSCISVYQVARQLDIYFSATVYIHAPWKRRGLLWKTHLARELRLGEQFDPRHCRRQLFGRTSRANKARTLRAAAGVCRRFLRLRAPPECPSCVGARSSFVHPRRGGLEKSGARRAGTKASRSATPSIKRPSTASWW